MNATRLRWGGFYLLGATILFSVFAISRKIFGDDWVTTLVVLSFAAAIRLVIAGVAGLPRRIGWSWLFAAVIWLAFAVVGSINGAVHNEEGGPVAALLVFGYYLGLPIACLSSLLGLITVRAKDRVIL